MSEPKAKRIKAYAAYAAKEKVKDFEYEREVKDDDVRVAIDCW